MHSKKFVTTLIAIIAMVTVYSGAAQADDPKNTFRIGYARVNFDLQSGDLTGPAGTVPPGIGVDANNLNIFAMSYERLLSHNWAVQFQAGIPAELTVVGARAAKSMGPVATARVWFPTLMAVYKFTDVPIIQPYVAAGATYTFFTNEKVDPAYTAAFQGSSSKLNLDDYLSPFARVGIEYPIDKNWCINMEYSTFRFKTTATVATQTPGFGEITRHIDVKDWPSIFGLTVGYKF